MTEKKCFSFVFFSFYKSILQKWDRQTILLLQQNVKLHYLNVWLVQQKCVAHKDLAFRKRCFKSLFSF